MSTNIKIAIAESSAIIRCGLETLLKRLPGFRIQISEITAADCLTEGLRIYKPDILIMNPSIPGNCNLQHLKDECGCPDMKCFALLYNVSDPFLLRPYDEQISVYDSADELKHKLERLNTEDNGHVGRRSKVSYRDIEVTITVRRDFVFAVEGLLGPSASAGYEITKSATSYTDHTISSGAW